MFALIFTILHGSVFTSQQSSHIELKLDKDDTEWFHLGHVVVVCLFYYNTLFLVCQCKQYIILSGCKMVGPLCVFFFFENE